MLLSNCGTPQKQKTLFYVLVKLSETDGFEDPLDRTPRRRDPPTWLKENPDYEVEGDMLEVHLQSLLFTFSLASKVALPASILHLNHWLLWLFLFAASCEQNKEEEEEKSR